MFNYMLNYRLFWKGVSNVSTVLLQVMYHIQRAHFKFCDWKHLRERGLNNAGDHMAEGWMFVGKLRQEVGTSVWLKVKCLFVAQTNNRDVPSKHEYDIEKD